MPLPVRPHRRAVDESRFSARTFHEGRQTGESLRRRDGDARDWALSLVEALDYLDLLAEVKPTKLDQAALRWHGRLELESTAMTMSESQLALTALSSLCAGERSSIDLLRKLLR